MPALTGIYNAAITGTGATSYLQPFADRRAWWNAHQDPRFPIIVAEQAEWVVGYASLNVWTDGPVYTRTAEISVFLAPEARGHGLGALLLRFLMEEAIRQNHHALIARVWASNAASLALCRKCGFETVGIQREVGTRNGVWEDCVMMQLLLPDQENNR